MSPAGSGSRPRRALHGRPGPFARNQLSRKTASRSRTTGPSRRTCASRHSSRAYPPSPAAYSSPMLRPPVNATSPVHHQDLAVIAAPRREAGIAPRDGVEGDHLGPRLHQRPELPDVEAPGADGVVEQPHVDPRLGSVPKGLEEGQADGVRPQDVGLEVDAIPGRLDRRPHGRKPLAARVEEIDAVALGEAEAPGRHQRTDRLRPPREPVAAQARPQRPAAPAVRSLALGPHEVVSRRGAMRRRSFRPRCAPARPGSARG